MKQTFRMATYKEKMELNFKEKQYIINKHILKIMTLIN